MESRTSIPKPTQMIMTHGVCPSVTENHEDQLSDIIYYAVASNGATAALGLSFQLYLIDRNKK